MQPRSGYWNDLTTDDFGNIDRENTIALLPVGAVEQHGPHLPLGTDATIGEGIVARCLAQVPDGISLLILPMQSIGDSVEHESFPGTLSVSTETLLTLWTEIGESVARAGLKKLIVFNSHGGQRQVVDIVAHRLRARLGMLVVRATYFSFGVPDNSVDEHELAHGIHGGTAETSLMLSLAPHTVRTHECKNFVPISVAMRDEYALLGAEKPIGFGWSSQDLHPQGVAGDATAATPELGHTLLEHAASQLATLVCDTAKFPLSSLR